MLGYTGRRKARRTRGHGAVRGDHMGLSRADWGPGGFEQFRSDRDEDGVCEEVGDSVDTMSRLPDPVRAAAVRAVVLVAVTLVLVMIAVLCSLAMVWLALPMVLAAVASTVVTTWGVLDVWVTRQMWVQRNGVVSTPGSVARERGPFRRGRRAPSPGETGGREVREAS
ncbi:hypothetical protein GCM10010420_44610 [Streptomyces glaucosporus]|uniref:Integral membrane protein n=2 Tax=Streptomyces glaucosporus TaxID=284044 RepID=A0ABP5VSS2_9ACTN